MRYKVIISYDGSNFNGFQVQNDSRTIQGEIEKALKLVTKTETTIHASGRTDAKVHAKGQVFHFDSTLDISAMEMKKALNATLPDDIFVRLVTRVSDQFHSRYNVRAKEYEYLINMGEYNPLLRNYVLQYCHELDVEKMQEALNYFLGEHDFRSFVTGIDKETDTVRTIESAKIEQRGLRISVTLKGNGFLRYMVRGIVGTLIEVGNGKLEPTDVVTILEKQDRCAAGANADSCGLYLTNVFY